MTAAQSAGVRPSHIIPSKTCLVSVARPFCAKALIIVSNDIQADASCLHGIKDSLCLVRHPLLSHCMDEGRVVNDAGLKFAARKPSKTACG